MKSIAYIPASNESANSSMMTVQSVRASGATSISVNTTAGVPDKFFATMGAPHTFTDPVTSEEITIISEETAVDFAGHLDSGHIEIDSISPGYEDTRGSEVGDIVVVRPTSDWANNIANIMGESHNDDGSIKESAVKYDPNVSDHVHSGGVWSILTGLNAAMTALTGYQGGKLCSLNAVDSHAFTASKDTYIDILRTTSDYTNAFSLVYTEVSNGAASPALAANSIRLAKVITGASAITSITQTGFDSLGNRICPNKPVTSQNMDSSTLMIKTTVTNNTGPGYSTTWQKRTYSDGTIIYSHSSSPDLYTAGNSWAGDIVYTLPDGISFNSATMDFSGATMSADSAVTLNLGIKSGEPTIVRLNRRNSASNAITTATAIHMKLVIYPR